MHKSTPVIDIFFLLSILLILMFSGLSVYFTYSYRNSGERTLDDQEVVLYEITDNSKEES